MRNLLLLLVLTVFLVSCSKFFTFLAPQQTRTPEQAVRSFIELSASVKEMNDRKRLQDLCSGEMRRIFERMTEEMFQLSYLKNQIVVKDLKFLSVDQNGDEAIIHYQVTIQNNQGVDPTLETNEREVDLARARGAWYLEAIRPKGQDTIAFTRGMVF